MRNLMRRDCFAILAMAGVAMSSCGRRTSFLLADSVRSDGRCDIGKIGLQDHSAGLPQERTPLLATGPTAAILVRQQLLDSYAPSFLEAVEAAFDSFGTTIKVISIDDQARAETSDRAAQFDAQRYPHIDFVHLDAPYATRFRSGIFIQDSFSFRWNSSRKRTELIVPTGDANVRMAYGAFAADCELATVEVDLVPTNSGDLNTALVTYAAGGNLEALPGQILISSAPSQDRLLVDQIPRKTGREYDSALSELIADLRDRDPSLTAEQAAAQAGAKLSSSEFQGKIRAKFVALERVQSIYRDAGYTPLELDFYSGLGYKLSEIDHIDEYVQAFRHDDGGPCRLGLLVASPLDAFDLLSEASPRTAEDRAFCRRASETLMQNRTQFSGFSAMLPEAKSRGCMLRNGMTDREFADTTEATSSRKHFEEDQASIDGGIQHLKERLASVGCPNPKIVKIPTFLTINSVNALIVTPEAGTSTIIRPDTNLALFESAADRILRENSVPTISVPAQGLAFGDGNLHCATSVLTRGR